MHPLDERETDWSGVKPDQAPIPPLDAVTFLQRLQLLSDRASGVTKLRNAFHEQNSNDEQI